MFGLWRYDEDYQYYREISAGRDRKDSASLRIVERGGIAASGLKNVELRSKSRVMITAILTESAFKKSLLDFCAESSPQRDGLMDKRHTWKCA
jgi:hypothetical protein